MVIQLNASVILAQPPLTRAGEVLTRTVTLINALSTCLVVIIAPLSTVNTNICSVNQITSISRIQAQQRMPIINIPLTLGNTLIWILYERRIIRTLIEANIVTKYLIPNYLIFISEVKLISDIAHHTIMIII